MWSQSEDSATGTGVHAHRAIGYRDYSDYPIGHGDVQQEAGYSVYVDPTDLCRLYR
jgi:hypothetical protein